MREIKFRRWSFSNECMCYSEVVGLEEFFSNTFGENVSEDMQYTGLKDVNGVEIYEGDVLSALNENSAVKFDDGSFYIGIGKIDRIKLSQQYIVDCGFVVTGNIYED